MILVIDNYDSFVQNLARYFVQLGCETRVVRNDAISLEEIAVLTPAAIVLSPGPCSPAEAGICLNAVARFANTIPMLGICLGHQAIAQSLGGKIVRAREPMHGRQSEVEHAGSPMFDRVPSPLLVGRYHSLVVEGGSTPDCLKVTAKTDDGTIMAVEHASRPLIGLQFHPESILTEYGYQLLANFLAVAKIPHWPERVGGLAAQHELGCRRNQRVRSSRLSMRAADGTSAGSPKGKSL